MTHIPDNDDLFNELDMLERILAGDRRGGHSGVPRQPPTPPAAPPLPQPPAVHAARHWHYATRQSLEEALIAVVYELWTQYKRTGQRPTRVAVTDKEHHRLWPDGIQPTRRLLYAMLKEYQLDFDELVEDVKDALFPTGI
jgi:hypothetical protein